MMATHELKTDPGVFQDLIAGEKTYEIRRDDRGFEVGDTLVLRETEHSGEQMATGAPMEYTGRTAIRRVTHALRGPRYGLAEGWAILSVNDPEKDALAAHVERLTGTIEFLLDTGEWSSHTTVSQMAKGDISLAPTASLDRLKAQWQVEGAVLVGALLVDKYESNFPGGEDEILQICDYALRRQAEKGGDL